MITNIDEILGELADGPLTDDATRAAVTEAVAQGFGAIMVEDLKVGDDIGYVTMDVFGWAPTSRLLFSTVTRIEPSRSAGYLTVRHGGEATEAYPLDMVLARPAAGREN